MRYSDNDDIMGGGDVQETDGVNRAETYLDDGRQSEVNPEHGLVDELNAILAEPRYDGDMCITLTMPVQMIKKAREKVNYAIMKVYEMHRSQDFKVFDVLMALESMVDAPVISAILDMDIKRMIASDRGIVISDRQLEEAVAPRKVSKKAADDPDIVTCPTCGGSGNHDGGTCTMCGGIGKVRRLVENDIDRDDYPETDEMEDFDDFSDLDGLDDVVLED